jgi:nucleotide-binding universal stress UspA family protein
MATPVPDLFQHVLVGIDETPESLVAAAQARALRSPGGRVELLAVAETYLAVHAGAGALVADDDLYVGTQRALERARELVEPDDARMLAGRLVDALHGECDRNGATLVAVGVRPHRRLGMLVFGGHDIEVLHEAPCSILVARPGWGPSKPERILVGVDSTPESRVAEEVACSLAVRLGRELVPVVGLGEDVDLDLLRAERDQALLDPRGLADALGAAARPGDLVLVGRARQPHGRGADLAERAVYATRCSVLVVRPPVG